VNWRRRHDLPTPNKNGRLINIAANLTEFSLFRKLSDFDLRGKGLTSVTDDDVFEKECVRHLSGFVCLSVRILDEVVG